MSKRKKNIFLLFLIVLIIAESIFITLSVFNLKANLQHQLEDKIDQVENSYEAVYNTFGLVSEVIYNQIINTTNVQQLFSQAYKSSEERRAQIRDSLFQLLNPIYSELSNKSIKQLHFHLPDNRSFLRFHSPDKFGDDLSEYRETVKITNSEKRVVQSFEEGRVYDGFRFVYPLSYNNEHIGSVETSVSFGAISNILYKQAKDVYSFILKKEIIDLKVFDDKKDHYIPCSFSDDWVEEDRFSHLKTTNELITKQVLVAIDHILSRKENLQLNEGKKFGQLIRVGKTDYLVCFIPVFNFQKEHAAYVISYSHDHFSNDYKSEFYIFLTLGVIGIFIIISLFYLIYVKNLKIDKQQLALVESAARYQHIYNTIDVGIISNDIKGNIHMANPKLLEILGYSTLQELQAVNIEEVYKDPGQRKKVIAELLASKGNLKTGELLWKKKDGKEVLIKFTGKHHINPNKDSYLESVVQDITELRKLEESLKSSEQELRESNATKDRFFSILAHDLRGPFNSLIGFSEILALHPQTIDETQKKRFNQIIFENIKKLSGLLENLLKWSQAQQGTIKFEPTPINLKDIVIENLNLFEETAFSKNIYTEENIDKNIQLYADLNMVNTIIRNTISNALKFTHKNGRVKISAQNEHEKNGQKFIEIVVQDNGIGISKSDQKKIFKIDSGFSNPGTENEKGSGLGLILIKEFIQYHNGLIKIESETGIGTKVIFTLPLHQNS